MSRTKLRQQTRHQKTSLRDAVRLMLALVFILFAAIASRDHEVPEQTIEAQEVASSQVQTNRPHARDEKRTSKIPEASVLSRINGAI